MRAKIKTGKQSTVVGSVSGQPVSDLLHLIDQLKAFPEFQSDSVRLAALDSLCAELQKPNAEYGVIGYYVLAVRAATTTVGAVDILNTIATKLREASP